MSEYRIIILISDKKISALDISEKNNIEKISIEGNENMPYQSEKDMAVFCDYIRSYYNIDEFSDIDLSVSIVKLNAGMEYIRSLVEEINKAKEYNLINIESILPLLMLKEQKVKANSNYELEIFGEGYRLFVDQEWNIQVEKVSLLEKKIVINEEKLVLFYYFNAIGLIGDARENNGETGRKLEKQIEKLETEKRKKEERYICKFYSERVEESVQSQNENYTISIEFIVHNGDIVRRKQKIANYVIGKKRNLSLLVSKEIYPVESIESGRIFFLKENGEEVKPNEDIAIIGNLSDTKEDVMEWYRKLQ